MYHTWRTRFQQAITVLKMVAIILAMILFFCIMLILT